jgi:phage terminase large subunit-like protein
MFEFRATTQNFSPAIIEIDAAMRAGRLVHDGNPALEWCLGTSWAKLTDAESCIQRNNSPIGRSMRLSR